MSHSEDYFGPLKIFVAAQLIATISVAANAQVPESIAECRALQDNAARLVCYDEAVSREVSIAGVAGTTAALPFDDEVGKESLAGADAPAIVGRLVECKGDYRSKYHFYFDNGQVWKQTNNTRIRWKDCNFDVNIEKDAFGYKMSRVGEKKTVRIARIR